MAGYYKTIKGKTYDKKLLDAADKSVKGKGDGRISLGDAKRILAMVKDSGDYSAIEKKTIQYIRDKYDFTPESDKWFRTEIKKWAATRAPAAKPKPAAKKKTTAKKSVVKKTAVKRAAVKKPAAQKPAPVPVYREELSDSGIPTVDRPIKEKKESGGMSMAVKLLLIAVLVAAAVLIYIFLSPACRDKVTGKFFPSDSPAGQPAVIEPTPPSETPAVMPQVQQKPAAEEADAANVYTVQVKDDLVKISEKKLGASERWKELYEANKDTIKNPTLIFPGQKLKVPESK